MTEPEWLRLARKEVGVKESPGFENNPVVQQYYVDAGTGKMPDSVPWCAAFVGAMLKRAGYKGTGMLAARTYLNWGTKLVKPKLGCIVVFERGNVKWQGHVTLFIKEHGPYIRCLGGNQNDAVTYADYPKSKLLGYRWPKETK
jgi:uncharacterized protein (TIGR02594 family)